MSNDEKLKERFPSMRDVWPPNTVGVKVSPPSSSNDEHGEHVSVTESFDEPVQPVPPVGRVAAIDALVVLKASEQALDLARVHARECRATVLACRGTFSKALADWNRTMPVQSQQDALRQYVNQSQADRTARAAAGQGVYYPGITRTAKAMSGGNAKQGGGAGYRRGAFTRAQAMELNARAARMNGSNASRVKMSSDR